MVPYQMLEVDLEIDQVLIEIDSCIRRCQTANMRLKRDICLDKIRPQTCSEFYIGRICTVVLELPPVS